MWYCTYVGNTAHTGTGVATMYQYRIGFNAGASANWPPAYISAGTLAAAARAYGLKYGHAVPGSLLFTGTAKQFYSFMAIILGRGHQPILVTVKRV